MNAHTPGPWHVRQQEDDNGLKNTVVGFIHESGSKLGIATIWRKNATSEAKAEQEANAALIALAPQLLAQRNELRSALDEIRNTLANAKPVDYKRDCYTALSIACHALENSTK